MDPKTKERCLRRYKLLGCTVSGTADVPGVGKCTFSIIGGKQTVRRYVKPSNPRTEKQLEHRRIFAEAIKAWQALPPEVKTEYNRRGRRMKMCGCNLFVKENAKDTSVLIVFCPT